MKRSPSFLMSLLYDNAMKTNTSGTKVEGKTLIPGTNLLNLHPYATLLYNDQLIDGQKHDEQSKKIKHLHEIKQLLIVDMFIDDLRENQSSSNPNMNVHHEEKKTEGRVVASRIPSKPRSIFTSAEKAMAASSSTYIPKKNALQDILPLLKIDKEMDAFKKSKNQKDALNAIEDLLAIDRKMDTRSKLSASEKLRLQQKASSSFGDRAVQTQRRSIFTYKEKTMARNNSIHDGLNLCKI